VKKHNISQENLEVSPYRDYPRNEASGKSAADVDVCPVWPQWNWDELWELPRYREVMRFTLYYDGGLPSSAGSGRLKEKHEIREKLHWQILQLFRTHPELPRPPAGDWAGWPQWQWPQVFKFEHRQPLPLADGWRENDVVVPVGDLHYVPLVRASLDMVCELDILFLRPGAPGLMERGGVRFDIDNRLLTLFDALTVPQPGQQEYTIANNTLDRNSPMFCLLSDDSRITAVNVRTDSLLSAKEDAQPHHVRLIIGVTLKAIGLTWANIGLAG
jgi:hypothetical protein